MKPYKCELTFEERIIIEKHRKLGISCRKISTILGRGKNTIVVEVKRNSIDGKYCADKAQKFAEERRIKQYEKLSELNKKNSFSPLGILKQKIENIEMQLDILFEILRGKDD